MSSELLTSLDNKVRALVTQHETLRLEIAQLQQENQRLLAEQREWEEQLQQLLQRFNHIEPEA